MGMGNVVAILVTIAVVMWIISNLFRGGEDARAQQGQRQFPRREDLEEEEVKRPRSLASDVDRFLAEIQRRKQEAEERQRLGERENVSPPRRPQPAPSRPVEAAIPTVLPVAQPVRPKPKPTPRVPSKREVVVEPVLPAAVSFAAEMEVAPATPAAGSPSAPAAPATRPAAKAPPPAAAPLVALLRSQQTLRTAILLHEVLGPPRCRRR